MRTNNMMVGAAIAFMLVLGGCAQPGNHITGMGNPPQQAPKNDADIHTQGDCVGGACSVQITIGPGCRVVAQPFIYRIPKKSGPVTIQWTLGSSDDWVFDDLGIDFKGSPEFDNPKRVNDHTFEVHDENSAQNDHTSYRYTITLRNSAGKCTYDPIIINGV